MKKKSQLFKGNTALNVIDPAVKTYYSHSKELLNKYQDILKQMYETGEGSDTLPANGHDICNYAARYGFTNYQIQSVLKLDGCLDFDRLKRAVRLSLDAEPVLGCRFIENDPPYWKRRENIDEIPYCTFEVTENMEDSILQFLKSSLDMDNDTMVKVKLIRSEHYDTLCVKINHACSDAGGAKMYLSLLSDIYSRLCHDSTYIPRKSKRTRKDHYKLFKKLGISNPEIEPGPAVKNSKPTWNFPWKNSSGTETDFVICRLPYGQLDNLISYSKARGATINDMILTALYRAMFKKTGALYYIPMEIEVTVDLRRYLPGKKAEAIRNFSGGIVSKLARNPHETFEKTLLRVSAAMKRSKEQNPGLGNALAAERVEKMSFRRFISYIRSSSKISKAAFLFPYSFFSSCAPVLSNLGLISETPVKFGDNTVADAYFVPPVVRSPGLLIVASTYNGILTLSVGYYKSAISKGYMERLLNKIKNEMIEGCIENTKTDRGVE